MNGEGEHPKARDAMADIVRRHREMGVPVKDAEKKARDAALREDRKRNA